MIQKNLDQKSLDQLTSEELKEVQDQIKQEIRNAKREINRNIFSAERAVREARFDLEKKIKEASSRDVLRAYAQNILTAQRTCSQLVRARVQIQSLEAEVMRLFANIKVGNVLKRAAEISTYTDLTSNFPAIMHSTQKVAQQLERHGIVIDMVNDAFGDIADYDPANNEIDELIKTTEDSLKSKNSVNQASEKSYPTLIQKVQNINHP